jgi:5'-deoxynucleotidase YfbR-like HD superfamily hydrolase
MSNLLSDQYMDICSKVDAIEQLLDRIEAGELQEDKSQEDELDDLLEQAAELKPTVNKKYLLRCFEEGLY